MPDGHLAANRATSALAVPAMTIATTAGNAFFITVFIVHLIDMSMVTTA
jgi:hypothetical protein